MCRGNDGLHRELWSLSNSSFDVDNETLDSFGRMHRQSAPSSALPNLRLEGHKACLRDKRLDKNMRCPLCMCSCIAVALSCVL